MKASQLPWWGWVLLVIGAIGFLEALDVGLIPLIILGIIGWKMVGKQLAGGAGPRNRVPPGDRPAGGGAAPADRPGPGSSLPGGAHGWTGGPDGPPPMPTINVPPYPGSSGAPGAPAGAGGYGRTGRSPAGGDDPARSLLRLQLAQAGRDLEQALAAGDAVRSRQLLEGMDRLLTAGRTDGGSERALHGEVRSALSALTGDVGGVDRAALNRVVARCRSMGQTGHHE